MGNVQQQKEEKKLHLMQAAETMFLQKGFAGTSIDDIVRTAGVAKGTFYLYFQDKAEIWDAVVVQISLRVLAHCFCSPYLSRYSLEEAYRLMFMIIEMVGSISYTSIILEQPAPIDQMKPLLFRAIRRILA